MYHSIVLMSFSDVPFLSNTIINNRTSSAFTNRFVTSACMVLVARKE